MTNMLQQNLPYNYEFQDIQYYVVIDFEATCDKYSIPQPQEIIEFPSVIVSSFTGKIEGTFQTYVQPTCNKLLTDFCKDLTGIQQTQIDNGVTLSEALLRHDYWLHSMEVKNFNFAVVTWSNWDCGVMLESECRYKNIRKPSYFNRWINLRVPFNELFGKSKCNLKEAVEMAGLTWEGRPHCGLDDAMNTARLLALIMHSGYTFSITNSLTTLENRSSTFVSSHTSTKQLCRPRKENIPFCHCRVSSSFGTSKRPGPKEGSVFFRCGNWPSDGHCQFFEWATPGQLDH